MTTIENVAKAVVVIGGGLVVFTLLKPLGQVGGVVGDLAETVGGGLNSVLGVFSPVARENRTVDVPILSDLPIISGITEGSAKFAQLF
jgi:hypothetical protein